jgi:Killing trait
MPCNDNDQNAPPPPDPPGPRPRDAQFDEMSLSGGSVAVALGIVSLDAAHSLSLAMQNAVVEQQNGWTMQRMVMAKAVDQLLRNDAGDRAVDLLLRLFNRPEPSAQ